jgi:hypothetical protein
MSLFTWSRKKPRPATIPRTPKGAFTVDSSGQVVMTTLPAAMAARVQGPLCEAIISAFRDAHRAQLALTELTFNFQGLRVTARELRGGAIVFLYPIAGSPEATRQAT